MLLFTADYKGMFFHSLIMITRVIKEVLQHQSNKQNLFVINKTKFEPSDIATKAWGGSALGVPAHGKSSSFGESP
jgi:hypothetical protein